MTFLELCQRLRSEAAISGTGPYSVTGQTGEMAQVVEWVTFAYQDVQRIHHNWDFLRDDFTFETIPNINTYTPQAAGATSFGEWKIDTLRAGIMDIVPIAWDEYRYTYQKQTSKGNVSLVAQKPDMSLIFFPTPAAAQIITGEYYREPHIMVANTDTPIFPTRFHMIVVWRALMLYAAQNAATDVYVFAENEFKRIRFQMERSQLPEIKLAGTLA